MGTFELVHQKSGNLLPLPLSYASCHPFPFVFLFSTFYFVFSLFLVYFILFLFLHYRCPCLRDILTPLHALFNHFRPCPEILWLFCAPSLHLLHPPNNLLFASDVLFCFLRSCGSCSSGASPPFFTVSILFVSGIRGPLTSAILQSSIAIARNTNFILCFVSFPLTMITEHCTSTMSPTLNNCGRARWYLF